MGLRAVTAIMMRTLGHLFHPQDTEGRRPRFTWDLGCWGALPGIICLVAMAPPPSKVYTVKCKEETVGYRVYVEREGDHNGSQGSRSSRGRGRKPPLSSH